MLAESQIDEQSLSPKLKDRLQDLTVRLASAAAECRAADHARFAELLDEIDRQARALADGTIGTPHEADCAITNGEQAIAVWTALRDF